MSSPMPKWVQHYSLFKECLEALKVNLLPEEEADKLFLLFKNKYPIAEWGKIDWDKIDNHIPIGNNQHEIFPALSSLLATPIDTLVYIVWSSAAFPVIQTNLNDVINYFDDVTCVSFETFIFNPTQNYIIEVRPGNEITLGVLNT